MTSPGRYRTTLGNRQFALLWSGQSVSLFGDGVLALALPLLVISTHHSDAQLGLVVAVRIVALVVLLLVGGVISDRISRRTAMLLADAARGAITLALGLLALDGHLGFATLLVGSFLLGCFDALFMPASTAMIPDVVPADQLMTANSLTQLSRTLAPLLGPVVAGLVAPSSALLIDAGTFLVSAGFLVLMHPTPKGEPSGGSVLAEVREGLGYCRRTPWLWWTILVAGVANAIVWAPAGFLVVLLLTRVLASPHWQVGLAFAATSLGGAIGAVVAGRTRPPRRRVRTMWLVWAAAGCIQALVGLAPSPWVVGILGLLGAPFLLYGSIVWDALLQKEVPRALLGRVSSVDWLVSLGVSPIGVALAGAVAGAAGVRPTIVVPALCDVALSLVVLALVPALTAIDRRQPPEHEAADEPATT